MTRFADWTEAEKVTARRLYRSHTSAAIAKIMGRTRADVSALMRAMNAGAEMVPAKAALDTMTVAERSDYSLLRSRGLMGRDEAASSVLASRARQRVSV